MTFVSCDFETCRFRPGLQAPPPVCMSIAEPWSGGSPLLWTGDHEDRVSERTMATIFATSAIDTNFRRLVTLAADGKLTIVGHNFAYDAAVAMAWIPDVVEPLFAAYERGAIVDTMAFERIAEIGKFTGRKILSLQVIGGAYGIQVEKDEATRTGYGQFYGEPLAAYPRPFVKYPLDDADNTLELLKRQMKRHGQNVHLADVAFLARRALWLQLVKTWGLRTDPDRLDVLRKATAEHVDHLRKLAAEAKIEIPNKKGVVEPTPLIRAGEWQTKKDKHSGAVRKVFCYPKNMAAIKAWVVRAYDGKPPTTDTGEELIKEGKLADEAAAVAAGYISTSRVTLEESGDYILQQFAEYGQWSAVENKDLPMLERGAVYPIHTKFGVADTLRSTSSDPNIQNFRREEKIGKGDKKADAGIRECVIPRPGFAFVGVDHGGLELSTLAQVIVFVLGSRHMADLINKGIDLHCWGAVPLVGKPYEWVNANKKTDKDVKLKRNCTKVINFGRPGYMGAPTLVHYAKYSYGVDFVPIARALGYSGTDEEVAVAFARQLIKNWETTLPEGPRYLEYCKTYPEAAGGKVVRIPGTTIVRRGATLPASANTGFQGLGAVVEAMVGWAITREMYCPATRTISVGGRTITTRGPLAHCRQWNFVHDEHLLESPIAMVTDVGNRLEEIMATVPQSKLPDVMLKSEAVAMARWSKRAESERDAEGRLLIWDEAA